MEPDLQRRVGDFFQAQGRGIACVYLFGSRARGDFRQDSDLDVAVLFEHTPPETLEGLGFDIAEGLQESVGVPVDVVVLNRAPPELIHRILSNGVLVYEANRSARVSFEVRARAEYFDVLPYLRAYRRWRGNRRGDRS